MSNFVGSIDNVLRTDFNYLDSLPLGSRWQVENDYKDKDFPKTDTDSSLDEISILSANFGWLKTQKQEIHSPIELLTCSCQSCCDSSAFNFEFTDIDNNSNSPQSAPFATGDYRTDALIGSYPWAGNTITYSFFDGGYYNGENGEIAWEVSEGIKYNVRYIIENYIEPLVDVDFVEVSDAGNSYGTIRYMLSDGPGYAYAYYPYNLELGGDVHFNPDYDNASTTNGFQSGIGSHGFETLIHETLHALGLKHPGDYNGDGSGDPPFLPYQEDNNTNTVMTYNFAGDSASSMMPYDILALQYLYGASNYNAGNTTYTFDTVFGFSDGTRYWGSSNNYIETKVSVWDSGGIDSLNLSQLGYSYSGYFLDLNEGGILTTGNAYDASYYQALGDSSGTYYTTTTYGTALGYNMTIENAIGSSSNDGIIGNNAPNDIRGKNGNDIIFGKGGDDILDGDGGNDSLEGGSGDDILDGGAGSDTLVGGTGDDVYIVNSTGDVIIENNGEGIDLVQSSVNFTLDSENALYDLILTGTANIRGTGNRNDNIIIGNAGKNQINGNAGNDTLEGGNGDDTLNGGSGKDFVSGDLGNDNVKGGGGNDTLTGGLGKDTLRGGGGNDLLFGGMDTDVLYGNNGRDTFVIERVPSNSDRAVIKDYVDGTDFLGLADGLSFSDLTIKNGANNATIIRDSFTNNTLAILSNTDALVINNNDFVTV